MGPHEQGIACGSCYYRSSLVLGRIGATPLCSTCDTHKE